MTEETQFIAITHNKRTMETADVIRRHDGGAGCSKIVSVRFDEPRLTGTPAFHKIRVPGRCSSVGRAAVS